MNAFKVKQQCLNRILRTDTETICRTMLDQHVVGDMSFVWLRYGHLHQRSHEGHRMAAPNHDHPHCTSSQSWLHAYGINLFQQAGTQNTLNNG
jgi:hypothetical protein